MEIWFCDLTVWWTLLVEMGIYSLLSESRKEIRFFVFWCWYWYNLYYLFVSSTQLRKYVMTTEKDRTLELEHLCIKLVVLPFLWQLPENSAMCYKLDIGSSGKKIMKRLLTDASNNSFGDRVCALTSLRKLSHCIKKIIITSFSFVHA